MKPKSPWFDVDCIKAKRELNKAAKKCSKSPTDNTLRELYYKHRRLYRNLKIAKKDKYIEELCKDVEAGHNINWKRFNKLRKLKKEESTLDAYDMQNFCNFFRELYSKPSLPLEKTEKLKAAMSVDSEQTELQNMLDSAISLDELIESVKLLKKGKAVAEDLIANEFLKASNKHMLNVVLQLFNMCLEFSVYPWNASLVTPLLKKGDIYDPNNYRAIAVASNLGKLFSSILLQRLLRFRRMNNPDTPNQLGFCKNSQTCDHILTLSTCIEKYTKKLKERLYACFIDYKKAFDSVCREALLYKLWKMGIQGKFFHCIEYMYKNSTAKIKLLDKLSDDIDIACGTEQGHPLSPELFKCFIHQLSVDLNNGNSINNYKVPSLNNTPITHLLWADDLILLALDVESLQKMIDVLYDYCIEWGLTVNLSKTAIMVFNRSGRILNESKNFTYGGVPIPSVRDYCYLGVVFNLTGSFSANQIKLKQKAMGSYFSLKKAIDIRFIRQSTIHNIFDILIKPIASYGCEVWLPETSMFKTLASGGSISLQKMAKDPLEKLHLSVLKWTMGVNKKTSNCAVWGDTGRYPLAIELSKQVFKYYDRLVALDKNDSNALIRHAFCEQREHKLFWYRSLLDTKTELEKTSNICLNSNNMIRSALRTAFLNTWEDERLKNKKLVFYNSVKKSFATETYLTMNLTPKEVRRISQIRTSSHKFNIETGRYDLNSANPLSRTCKSCSNQDWEIMELLAGLPTFPSIIEDELHVLRSCILYEDLRQRLSQTAKTAIFSDVSLLFSSTTLIRETSRFLGKIHLRRFPKSKKQKEDISQQEKSGKC